MNGADEELTRESDIYQEAMRTKVINNLDQESQLIDIVEARHLYKYEGKMTWKSLTEKFSESNLSKKELSRIINMSKTKRAEYFGKTHFNTWRAKGEPKIDLELKLKIELPDGEVKCLFTKQDIGSFNDMKKVESIIRATKSAYNVNLRVIDEGEYVLDTQDGYTFDLNESLTYDGFSIPEYKSGKTGKLMSFFEDGNKWVEAQVKSPIEKKNDNKIEIPVEYNGVKINFSYESPNSNDEFWQIAEKLGGGDPLLVAGEDVYITHIIISNNGLFGNNIWTVRPEKPSKISKLYHYLPFTN